MKNNSLKEQTERSLLLKRVKLTIDYGKFADEKDIMAYIDKMDSDQRINLVESLNVLDEMFNNVA